ncbi:hypothetical protein [Streptomyces purpurogeneiscleroticus]|nr:hypothetical protein [Streptomyces purpurogeneiscleroticus]
MAGFEDCPAAVEAGCEDLLAVARAESAGPETHDGKAGTSP